MDAVDWPLCAACSGSGEGMYDGSTCCQCGGQGVVNPSEDDDWEDAECDRADLENDRRKCEEN